MSLEPRSIVNTLSRFGLTTTGADRLASFYESAFNCRRLATLHRSGADFERLMGVAGGARSITLGLGKEIIELLQFDRSGRPYPERTSASDLVFQHFAIVVADIEQAYRRLSDISGWSAISIGGPQRLPGSAGGVTAFKFRDPDGHPLEFLAFPDGQIPQRWKNTPSSDLCLGIDHSAISVSDNARSIAFYEKLGFRVSARSFNQGVEQARLDGVHEPRVDVTALSASETTPHIELLCYHGLVHAPHVALRNNDVAATRLVIQPAGPAGPDGDSTLRQIVCDPDGHHLVMTSMVAAKAPR